MASLNKVRVAKLPGMMKPVTDETHVTTGWSCQTLRGYEGWHVLKEQLRNLGDPLGVCVRQQNWESITKYLAEKGVGQPHSSEETANPRGAKEC